VFPEQVELVLQQQLKQAGLPIESLLLLPEEDPLWGARLLALVRPAGPQDWPALERALQRLAELLPPAQRPRQWLCCEGLERNAMGKWERQRWRHWLQSLP
jgi:O-succinylbenzoic acid--CoA ligase